MNYYCTAAVSALIFIIHLTVAAPPPEDFCQLLDELSEINIRMGEAIKRAKEMATAIQTNELKTSVNERDFVHNTIDAVKESYHQIGSTIKTAADQINQNIVGRILDDDTVHGQDSNNVTQQYSIGVHTIDMPKPEGHLVKVIDPEGNNGETTFVDNALDFIGNQSNDWTNASNPENVTENGVGTVENIQIDRNVDEVDQDLNEDTTNANIDQSNDKTNQQQEKVINSQSMDDVVEGQIDFSKEENSFGNNVDHGEEIGGEKNYNGDEIVEESDSWFGRAIDTVVNWFN